MVDLVKIRRKAKEKAARAAAEQAGNLAPARGVLGSSGPEVPGERETPVDDPLRPDESRAGDSEAGSQPPDTSAMPSSEGPMSQPAAGGEIDSPAERLERYKEQVGKARFLVSGAAVDEPSSDTEAELLTFILGGEQYAIDIGSIVEIIPARPAARVPNADPSIVGIISLRGTIVTLLDVRSRLRHSPAPQTTDSRIVVIDRRGETVGFVVDKVLRVV
jgi:hypothetical protein